MRNLFDQYEAVENRLTHALMSTLEQDVSLRRQFLKWVAGHRSPPSATVVFEQKLPGELGDLSPDDAERRGLPDGCITNANGWALLVESKFAAKIDNDQLRSQLRTAKRRGLLDVSLLLISIGEPTVSLPEDVSSITWATVYQWLVRQSRTSFWARTCANYMEVLEARESASEYLKEGTLTVFSGIPFCDEEPYTYSNARRLIGLMRAELIRDRRLVALGADVGALGRGAITGRGGSLVWDFIGLKSEGAKKNFTEHPHLTFGIHRDQVEATLTVPNGVRSDIRSRLLGKNLEDFREVIQETAEALCDALLDVDAANPQISVLQRRYRTQKSPATVDCVLRFDVRTCLPQGHKSLGRVKRQPQWLEASHAALASRRSNIQFQIGAAFPYQTCPIVRTPEIARKLVDVWLGCEPLVTRLLAVKA